MATTLLSLARRFPTAIRHFRHQSTVADSSPGALSPKPIKHYTFGPAVVTLVVTPFLYIGYYLGGEFADVIERLELYVPDDEDDDD